MKDNRQGNLWVWVGVVVVVIAVVIFFVWKPMPQSTGLVATYAQKGQLVPQFPKNLVLDSDAQVTNSYAITYSTSTSQYTATWESATSMISLFSDYETYLKGNGWTITAENTKYSTNRGIYAVNGSADVNVAIIPKDQGSEVTLSYVQK